MMRRGILLFVFGWIVAGGVPVLHATAAERTPIVAASASSNKSIGDAAAAAAAGKSVPEPNIAAVIAAGGAGLAILNRLRRRRR